MTICIRTKACICIILDAKCTSYYLQSTTTYKLPIVIIVIYNYSGTELTDYTCPTSLLLVLSNDLLHMYVRIFPSSCKQPWKICTFFPLSKQIIRICMWKRVFATLRNGLSRWPPYSSRNNLLSPAFNPYEKSYG